eukprot:503633-Amphidinium_carterae.1
MGTILSRHTGDSRCASHARCSQQQHFPSGRALLPTTPQVQHRRIKDHLHSTPPALGMVSL